MRLASPWVPRLSEGEGALADRLVAALVEDVASGRLPVGSRLPAHRDLAWRLGVGVGTVTRAYALLERRGLVRGERGRGMFVAAEETPIRATVDLSVNGPPQVFTDRLLAATFTALAEDLDAASFARYRPAIGAIEHRRILARWLSQERFEVPTERLFLTNGAQHGLAVAFAAACGAGGRLFTEAVTYPGAPLAARAAGIAVDAVALDAEGMVPAALDAALAATAGEAGRAVYVTPTLHNPTTATMGVGRRRELVAVARAHDVPVIEDDVYSLFGPAGLPSLAALAPERVIHVTGLSKALNPGLRLGLLVPPPELAAKVTLALQATSSMISPIACVVTERWILDGTARSIGVSIRQEAAARVAAARAVMPGLVAPVERPGFHVWLPLSALDAERTARRALEGGVLLTAPETTVVDPTFASTPTGLRLCLGGPSRGDLDAALAVVARASTGVGEEPAAAMV